MSKKMLMIFAVSSIALYCLGVVFQSLELTGRVSGNRPVFFTVGAAAVLLHGWLLYRWIDGPLGQNLSGLNMLSFAVWLSAVIILLAAVRRPLANLSVFVFPLAVVSILLVLLFPTEHRIAQTGQHPKELIHILSAAAAFSILCMAGFQGLLLGIQEYLLRHKYIGQVLKHLPPLETMEHLLFQMIWLGFIVLTLVVASSLYFFHALFSTPAVLQKVWLTVTVWVIFAVLLAGRYLFGWRGRRVTYYTLSGVSLLMVIYLGSQY